MIRPRLVRYLPERGTRSITIDEGKLPRKRWNFPRSTFDVMKMSSRGTPLSFIASPTSCSFYTEAFRLPSPAKKRETRTL